MLVRWIVFAAVLFAANAVSAQDADGDLVPDPFDNCLLIANGPNDPSQQVDDDLDGFGDVCDSIADVNSDYVVDDLDLQLIVASFGQTVPPADAVIDLTNDGVIGMPDAIFWRRDDGVPIGPSGLACAGITIPCTP